MNKTLTEKETNGRWIKTVYSRRWKSDEEEAIENAAVLIVGLMVVVAFLIIKYN